MSDFLNALCLAGSLIIHLDGSLVGIVTLALEVSLTALAAACAMGLPAGAAVALARFPGRSGVILVLNSTMGLPPVAIGLIIYLLLSRSGPLGSFGLLFTPTAMVFAQTVLIFPIVAALTRQIVEDHWQEYAEQLRSLGCTRWQAVPTLLWDARYSLATVVLAGFGRAAAEVGAVMIVGGNIDNYTRTITTAIVLETSRGNLPLALALAFIVVLLTTAVNGLTLAIAQFGRRGTG
jgi:tungstate transport system permease protein